MFQEKHSSFFFIHKSRGEKNKPNQAVTLAMTFECDFEERLFIYLD